MKLYFAERDSFIHQVEREGFARAVSSPDVDLLLSNEPPAPARGLKAIEVDVPDAERYELIEPLDLPDGRWFAIPASDLDTLRAN